MYNISSNYTLNNLANNYLKASAGTLKGATDGRGVKGDFYDWSNLTYYSFSILVRNNGDIYYHVEQSL
jgi:hypothetical protein